MGTGRKATVKYKVYDNGEFLGEFDYKEAAELTGCRAKNVDIYAKRGTPYKKRFRFERFDAPRNEFRIDKFKREWNEARLAVYKKTGKDAVICDKCGGIIVDAKDIVYQFGTDKRFHYECLLDEE